MQTTLPAASWAPLDLDEFSVQSLAQTLPGFARPHRIGAIRVRSADEASEIVPRATSRSYVIRLIDPVPSSLHPYPDLPQGHTWVREYRFDDVEPGAAGHALTPEMAHAILADLDAVLQSEKIDLLLVHCFAGASRSPAMAGALARIYGALSVPDFAGNGFWRAQIVPNGHVFDTMMGAALLAGHSPHRLQSRL